MLFLLCIIEREREFAASWQPNLSFYTTLYPTSLKGRIKDNERGRLLRGGQECPRMAFFNDVPLLVQSSLRMSSKCTERTARGILHDPPRCSGGSQAPLCVLQLILEIQCSSVFSSHQHQKINKASNQAMTSYTHSA